MVREEILEKSRELVNQIYEKMNVIESCDTLAKKVKDLEVCFNDSDNKQVVSLYGILSEGQLSTVRENIVNIIYSNATEAQSFLERLNRKPASINPELESAVQDMIESGKKQTKEKVIVPDECKTAEDTKPEITESEVTRLYIDEGKTLKEVADYFGVSKSAVNSYIYRHKLARKTYTKEDNGFRDAEVEQRRRERP